MKYSIEICHPNDVLMGPWKFVEAFDDDDIGDHLASPLFIPEKYTIVSVWYERGTTPIYRGVFNGESWVNLASRQYNGKDIVNFWVTSKDPRRILEYIRTIDGRYVLAACIAAIRSVMKEDDQMIQYILEQASRGIFLEANGLALIKVSVGESRHHLAEATNWMLQFATSNSIDYARYCFDYAARYARGSDQNAWNERLRQLSDVLKANIPFLEVIRPIVQ